MAELRVKQTRAIDVRNRMRRDILAGRLKPGQRLMFPDLCERYGASVGVTREALTWLAEQGLVRAQAHQGRIVTPLSRDDLQDLATARVTVEPLVLRSSIANRDLEWEARVVASHHVMVGTFRRMNDPEAQRDIERDEMDDLWAAAHAAFHEALFSACQNRRLIGITRSLAEEAALYRRWSDTLAEPRDIMAEHNGLLEAALAGDTELAAERLREHIMRTASALIIYAGDDSERTVKKEKATAGHGD